MDNYMSTKTVFINKLYEKFHKKNIENKLLSFNKKRHKEFFTIYGDYIVFKYKYYIFEAPRDIAEEIFWRFFKNRPIFKEQFLKNFEIESYENEECLEKKQNTKDTVYINKYQALFYYFWTRSLFIFKKIEDENKKSVDKILEDILKG